MFSKPFLRTKSFTTAFTPAQLIPLSDKATSSSSKSLGNSRLNSLKCFVRSSNASSPVGHGILMSFSRRPCLNNGSGISLI